MDTEAVKYHAMTAFVVKWLRSRPIVIPAKCSKVLYENRNAKRRKR